MERPPQLDDADWLRHAAAVRGDRAIAKELGTTRDVVRGARLRHGIQTEPGRRRGFTVQSTSTVIAVPVHERVLGRYQAARALDGPGPSMQAVIALARDTLLAHHKRDARLIEETLEALAVAALLALDRRQAAGPVAA